MMAGLLLRDALAVFEHVPPRAEEFRCFEGLAARADENAWGGAWWWKPAKNEAIGPHRLRSPGLASQGQRAGVCKTLAKPNPRRAIQKHRDRPELRWTALDSFDSLSLPRDNCASARA